MEKGRDQSRKAADAATARARVLTKAVLRASAQLGMVQAELGKVIGVSTPTASRMMNGRYWLEESSKPWELAALLVRVFRSLDALVGGDEQSVQEWFRAENVHLGGSPRNLARTVEGLTNVARYLDAMRGAQ